MHVRGLADKGRRFILSGSSMATGGMANENGSIPLEHRTAQSAETFGYVLAEHDLQLELCGALEEIADSLPKDLDRALAQRASSVLLDCQNAHVAVQEGILFDAAVRQASRDRAVEAIVRQLEDEHQRDIEFAYEIVDELAPLGRGAPLRNPEKLGYMLRGFFESQRRHLIWETRFAVPRIWISFSDSDIDGIQTRLKLYLTHGGMRTAIGPLLAYRKSKGRA